MNRQVLFVVSVFFVAGCNNSASQVMPAKVGIEIFDGCTIKTDDYLELLEESDGKARFIFGNGPDTALTGPASEINRVVDDLQKKSGISVFETLIWRGNKVTILSVEKKKFAPGFYFVYVPGKRKAVLITQTKADLSKLNGLSLYCNKNKISRDGS
jgi:hypothetical protein